MVARSERGYDNIRESCSQQTSANDTNKNLSDINYGDFVKFSGDGNDV